jgi:hypothetical protein
MMVEECTRILALVRGTCIHVNSTITGLIWVGLVEQHVAFPILLIFRAEVQDVTSVVVKP